MTMIIAVVAVVVVVVAGCAVLLSNHKDYGNKDAAIASELQIRGNANDDYTINADDMKIVDDIIAGSKTPSEYPLADVNGDGKVDTTDKTLLQNLIDRKSGSDVYVLCLDTAGNATTVKATYPLRNVVTYGTNIQLPALYANGGQYVSGYFKSSYAVAEGSIASTAVDLKGATREITDSAWANFTSLAGSLKEKGTPMGALLVDYSGVAQITATRSADLSAAGIPAIIYSSADPKSEVTTVLTLGFLFGGDCETLSVKYAQESWNVFEKINSKVGGLSDSDKSSYISFNMYIYVCQNNSTFNTTGEIAGGIPYYKVNSEFAAKYAGTSSTKMTSVEALANYKDCDNLVNIRSMDWGLTPSEVRADTVETWEHEISGTSSTEYFKGYEDKLFYIDNLLPGAVRVAYAAYGLYDDQFTREWADSVLTDYINMGTAPLKGQTLGSIIAYIDYDSYKAAKENKDILVSDNAVDIASTTMTYLTGNLSTGADGAKFAFQDGSNSTASVIYVANGNTSSYASSENTITIKVCSNADNAKELYEINEKDYSSQVGKSAMGATYVKANLTSQFDGLYGYYLNITSYNSASGHLSGYYKNVFFESYFYEKVAMTDADFQAVADAIFKGITNTEKYTGPEIPEKKEPTPIPTGGTGSALIVSDIVTADSTMWAAGTTQTDAQADLSFQGKTSKDALSETTVTVYNSSDAATKYSEKKASVEALIGTPSMGSKYPYSALTVSIDGVNCTAVIAKLSSIEYLQFVMQKGSIFVDGTSNGKLSIKSLEDADAIAVLQSIASELNSAKITAASVVSSDSTMWAAGTTQTDAQADLSFQGKTSKDALSETTVTVYNSSDAATKYSEKKASVEALIGKSAMGSSTTYVYAAFDVSTISGVQCTAVFCKLSSVEYLQFVMYNGTTFVDGTSSGKLSIKSLDDASMTAVLESIAKQIATA